LYSNDREKAKKAKGVKRCGTDSDRPSFVALFIFVSTHQTVVVENVVESGNSVFFSNKAVNFEVSIFGSIAICKRMLNASKRNKVVLDKGCKRSFRNFGSIFDLKKMCI
jgi:hypothetical protein